MRPLKVATAAIVVLGSFLAGFAPARDPHNRSNVPIEANPAIASVGKIVLIAGDAGVNHAPGDHEHFAGCALLFRMLKQTEDVAPVMVQNGWPANPAETLKNVRAVVFYMDGGGKQTTLAHVAEIDKLAAAGVGLVHLHQSIDYPAEFVPHAIQWLGGAYHPKTGMRGHWDQTFDGFVDHPITRGVEPFKLTNEGFINKLIWIQSMKGVTPILRAKNPKPKAGATVSDDDAIFCWAYERPDGGRSFVNTGGHAHANWGEAGFRRLTVNGILWAAKMDDRVSNGASVELKPEDLMQNLEIKPARKSKNASSQG